jgi:hypothetical protein
MLRDIQQLYDKLLHTCSATPQGKAFLTGLEEMLGYCSTKPFLLHRARDHVNKDLDWWSQFLQVGYMSQAIHPATTIQPPLFL